MKFTTNTKPLADALNLGVISSNVSKFYQKSTLAQVTCDRHQLKINLEAARIVSEIRLPGSGDEDTTSTVFVSCTLLKDLVNTFDSQVVTLEYVDGGLVLHSGKSKFNLPQQVDDADLALDTPSAITEGAQTIDLNKDSWKFVSDHQMFAIAMSFITPIYTKVWVSKDHDVIVGDYDNSIFTHSTKNNLDDTCLLSDTVINLFTSLPEGAKITKLEKSYEVSVKSDGYEYVAEFTPEHETDEGVGSYNADMILEMFKIDDANSITVKVDPINRFLNQAALLADNINTSRLDMTVSSNEIAFKNNEVDCKLPLNTPSTAEYTINFMTGKLKSVLSNMDEEDIKITPFYQEDQVVGAVFWTKNMSVLLAGTEEE